MRRILAGTNGSRRDRSFDERLTSKQILEALQQAAAPEPMGKAA
jgi:hypothetical protein